MEGTSMTTELIKTTGITLNGDKITAVNARDLWKFLESKQDFSTWIKRRIEKYEFIEGQDYLLHKFVEQLPSGAKHCIEYLISLDMAKELAMVENNERGVVRQGSTSSKWKNAIGRQATLWKPSAPPLRRLSAKMNNTAHAWNWPGTFCPTAIPAISTAPDCRKTNSAAAVTSHGTGATSRF